MIATTYMPQRDALSTITLTITMEQSVHCVPLDWEGDELG
jgi:hypothetical protein